MSHLVETMAYVGATPWHGLGKQLTLNQPIEVWAQQAGRDSPNVVRECLPALLEVSSGGCFWAPEALPTKRCFGTASSPTVHPREIVQVAVGHHTASVILAHTPPLGTP